MTDNLLDYDEVVYALSKLDKQLSALAAVCRRQVAQAKTYREERNTAWEKICYLDNNYHNSKGDKGGRVYESVKDTAMRLFGPVEAERLFPKKK